MDKELTKELYEVFKSENVIRCPDRFIEVWFILRGYLYGKTVDYDMEAIEDETSYGELFRLHAKAFKDELRVSQRSCKSFLDTENKKAGIAVTIGEETLEHAWDQPSDWVQPAFYEFIKNTIEPRLSGSFVRFLPIDQGYYGMYLPKETAKRIDSRLRELEEKLQFGKFY